MTNQSAIDQILARQETVDIGGAELTLSLPSIEAIREIRGLSAKAAARHEDETMPMEEALAAFQELSVKSISACVGCDENVALQLLVASGGETGDLCRAAQDMLGLARQEADADDPSLAHPI